MLRMYWDSSPPQYFALYSKVFLVVSTIYSKVFVIQGSFLQIWDKFKFQCKERCIDEGVKPSYTYSKYTNIEVYYVLLFVRYVCLLLTKTFVTKKNLVAFLSSQKLEGNQASSPSPLLFYQNRPIKTMRKPFSQKKIICKFRFNYSCAVSKNQNMH